MFNKGDKVKLKDNVTLEVLDFFGIDDIARIWQDVKQGVQRYYTICETASHSITDDGLDWVYVEESEYLFPATLFEKTETEDITGDLLELYLDEAVYFNGPVLREYPLEMIEKTADIVRIFISNEDEKEVATFSYRLPNGLTDEDKIREYIIAKVTIDLLKKWVEGVENANQ